MQGVLKAKLDRMSPTMLSVVTQVVEALERSRVAIRHVVGPCGHWVGEAQPIRGYRTVRHDLHAVPPCQRGNARVQIEPRESFSTLLSLGT